MKIEKYEVNAAALGGVQESPTITSLHYQSNGSLLCGLACAKPSLLRLKRDSKGQVEFQDLELDLGSTALGVTCGLRSTTSGDTTFAVQHTGMLPDFIAKLLGKSFFSFGPEERSSWLRTQDGGMGLWARHSVLMLSGDEITLRHDKMPGALVDVALVGDYLFGLSGSEIWREHYLKAEKRETLRSDLKDNSSLHRAHDGTFWLQGKNDRLLRLSHTDIRAKPTPLRLPGGGVFHLSAASSLDGWLYGTCRDSKTLFRLRLNSVSGEEELQKIQDFENPVTALAVCEDDEKGKLYLAVQEATGPCLHSLDLIRPEDPELIPDAPQVKKLSALPELAGVRTLTVENAEKSILWVAEASKSTESMPPKILRISELV